MFGIRRREFITLLGGAAAAWPFAARAQQAAKVPRVGVLSPGNPPPGDAFRQRERFEARLNELGWRPGSNIVVEYRYAEGKLERLPTLACGTGTHSRGRHCGTWPDYSAAHQATTTIPIVRWRPIRPCAAVSSPARRVPAGILRG